MEDIQAKNGRSEHSYHNPEPVIITFMLSNMILEEESMGKHQTLNIYEEISGIFPELVKDMNPQMVRAF